MKQNILRPMLAYSASLEEIAETISKLGGLYASHKLDGWRARVVDGRLLTRTGKPVPNRHTYNRFSFKALNGFDGELICGSPSTSDVRRRTQTAVSTQEGYPDVQFYVFDNFSKPNTPYSERITCLGSKDKNVIPLKQTLLNSIEEVVAFEDEAVKAGYEGIVLRLPSAPYKFGRANPGAGWMIKHKRYEDSEAVILDVGELYHNRNEAITNGRGYTERSHTRSGLVAAGTLGYLVVKDTKHPEWQFEIGSGFDAQTRKELWEAKDTLKGKLVTYKYTPHGIKDRPREPIFKSLRSKEDL